MSPEELCQRLERLLEVADEGLVGKLMARLMGVEGELERQRRLTAYLRERVEALQETPKPLRDAQKDIRALQNGLHELQAGMTNPPSRSNGKPQLTG